MMVTLILVLSAGLALLFFLLRIGGFGANLRNEAELAERLQPVDLDAFRNLVDPDEARFLQANLAHSEFCMIQRQRLLAAVEYIASVSHNAAVLLQLGQAARHSADPRVAEAGRHLVDHAVRLRLYSLIATGKLYVRIAFPSAVLEPGGIVDRYQTLSDSASLVGRLRDPSKAALMSTHT